MSVSASDVKALREKTGAGMMDCKKALSESNGDFEAATDWLRKKGLSAAAKKSDRVAAEGLVALALGDMSQAGQSGVLVELNAETDFVARNAQFQGLVGGIAKAALGQAENSGLGDLESLKALNFPGSERSVADEITHQIATIGENMSLRRVEHLAAKNGAVSGYIHGPADPSTPEGQRLGRIAVLVSLESAGDLSAEGKQSLSDLARKIAMHVAAARPRALDRESLDAAEVERERTILKDQALQEGRPPEIVEKMVDGRMRKFFAESVLLEQIYVMDNERTIAKVIEDTGKELGSDVKLSGYLRFELGEGIARKEDNFAAEVAAAVQS